jgi:hypothetical protein
MWTYEPRQGRNAATAVCSAFAVVTLVGFFLQLVSRFFSPLNYFAGIAPGVTL